MQIGPARREQVKNLRYFFMALRLASRRRLAVVDLGAASVAAAGSAGGSTGLRGVGSVWPVEHGSFAMGMMLYVMASGLTLIFGLMDVLNLAHSSFVTVGAFLTTTLIMYCRTPAGRKPNRA